ncbi:LexA family protein [Acetobacter vaccinii]|uniref:LexA family protein n=1 Tax=Acetobacter vaccinii TaxID=2592655 RepID=UPI0038D05B05
MDGDILIADTAALPRSGRLVIASAGGQILLAELRRQDTGWVLVSGDATRQALRVDPSQDVDIWGHVVGLVRTED